MATDLGRVKPAASSKHDAFVAAQLARAESRIRLLDLTAALLGFAALGLAYVVGMVLCDSKLELSQPPGNCRLACFPRRQCRLSVLPGPPPAALRVNPYYAARQVEQLLPGSEKQHRQLARSARPAAAAGHSRGRGPTCGQGPRPRDLEQAISGRRTGWAAGLGRRRGVRPVRADDRRRRAAAVLIATRPRLRPVRDPRATARPRG